MQSFATEKEFQEALQELSIELEVGNPTDKPQLKKLLFEYLAYPSDEQASCHEQANRLGNYDQEENRLKLKQNYAQNVRLEGTQNELPQICPCCCCLRQEDLIYRTDIDTIETIGEATALLFVNMKYSAWLMLSGFLVYGLYALITNVISSSRECLTALDFCSINTVALGSKILNRSDENRRLYLAQAWLGLVVSCLWALLFVYKAAIERKIELQQDAANPTASDFTVMIEDMPKIYSLHNLQAMLDVYAASVEDQLSVPNDLLYEAAIYDRKFTIEVLNEARPYYEVIATEEDQKPTANEIKVKELRKKLISFVEYRRKHDGWRSDNRMHLDHSDEAIQQEALAFSREQRMQTYLRFEDALNELTKERLQRLAQIEAKCDEVYKARPTKVVFVTFNHSYARFNLCNMSRNWLYRLWAWISCKKKAQGLKLGDAKITRAPQPEDIIWQNIGLPKGQRILRKAFTYVVSIITLALSFFIIYKLSEWQYNTASRTLSILISLFITAVNGLLAYIIRLLTLFEKDYRCTLHQISLTVKTVVAQLINSIVLSMLANYYIKNANLYKAGGLSEDVFYFAVSNALLSPLFKIVDVWWYWHLLWKRLSRRIGSKLKTESQLDYNKQWQRPEFEVGFEYAFVLKTCLYTAFYMSLQPIILIIGALGLYLMYYCEKYVLFYRSSRPRPSSNLINESLNYILYFSICAYALGSLTWTTFVPNVQPYYVLVPNLISLGIGLLVMMTPLNTILNCIKKEQQKPLVYSEERLFFSSEHERLNPHTREEGVRNFYSYLSEKKEEYIKKARIPRESLKAQETGSLFAMASKILGDAALGASGQKALPERGATTTQQFRRNNQLKPLEQNSRQCSQTNPQLMAHSSLRPLPADVFRLTVNGRQSLRGVGMFGKQMTQSRFRPLQMMRQQPSLQSAQDSLVEFPQPGANPDIHRIVSRTSDAISKKHERTY